MIRKNRFFFSQLKLGAGLLAAGLVYGTAAHAAGTKTDLSSLGAPGKAKDAARTVPVTLNDNYFDPATITVKKGETVRFHIVNKGSLLHEFTIETPDMHAAREKEMQDMLDMGMITATTINNSQINMPGMNMEMHHKDPNTAPVEPGKSADVIWKFSKETRLEFACNIPGHYEAGMVGEIKFQH